MKQTIRKISIIALTLIVGASTTFAQLKNENCMTKLEPTIEYLQKKSYTKPDYNVFRDKIEEVFKVDLDKCPGDEVLMGVKDGLVGGYDNDLYIVSKVGRFIYSPNLFVTESKPEEVFLHLNKYLFNEDKAAFNYLSASKNEQLGITIKTFKSTFLGYIECWNDEDERQRLFDAPIEKESSPTDILRA